MGRHSFIQVSKLTDIKGRIDYISNPKRQENLYGTYSTVTDGIFWDYLAGQNQEDFKRSGAKGNCIEARELIISLPEVYQSFDRELLLKAFVEKFKLEYGVDAIAALHHNKAMTNYHIHLIFSERKPIEKTEVKRASRNMFYDENGRHVRTKKEILNEDGEIRKGCYIVKKGEAYDIRYFQPKGKIFKSRDFTANVKKMYTDFINSVIEDESQRLSVFDHDGPYLATKKIGRNNPLEAEIKADNAIRQEWNHAVDEAVTAGVPEEKIQQVKAEMIQNPVRESIRKEGFRPDLLRKILKAAIQVLVSLIRKMPEIVTHEPKVDIEVFQEMQKVSEQLVQQNKRIAVARKRLERAQFRNDELSRPVNILKRKEKMAALKTLADAVFIYDEAIAEPDRIVRKAGYRNVAAFTKAYRKARELVIAQNKLQHEERDSLKESVLKKLSQLNSAAKSTPQKSFQNKTKNLGERE